MGQRGELILAVPMCLSTTDDDSWQSPALCQTQSACQVQQLDPDVVVESVLIKMSM